MNQNLAIEIDVACWGALNANLQKQNVSWWFVYQGYESWKDQEFILLSVSNEGSEDQQALDAGCHFVLVLFIFL